MQLKYLRQLGFCALITLTWSAGAAAKPVVLDIDFRDTTIWGGHGQTSYSYAGITVDSSPNSLYHDAEDGYGVLGGHENDEIDNDEVLSISFDSEFFSDVKNYITGVLLTDLFWRADGGPGGIAGWITLIIGDEVVAQFVINAMDAIYGSNLYLSFGGAFAPDRIVFTAYAGPDDHHRTSDYSVAGFTTVHEPGALLLMGTALLLFAWRRRRDEVRVRNAHYRFDRFA